MYDETISLGKIPPEGMTIERRIHPDAWEIKEPDWQTRGDLTFEAFIKANPKKISVKGKFHQAVTANCHRCLRPIDLDLNRVFQVSYLPPDPARFNQEEVELSAEELDMAYLDKDYLSLPDIISEQIYLALPMKFLCKADCLGLCPHCGANLNEVECICSRDEIDPRWAPLKAVVKPK